MQKVEGSSPFIRFDERPAFAGLAWFWRWCGGSAQSAAGTLGPLSVAFKGRAGRVWERSPDRNG